MHFTIFSLVVLLTATRLSLALPEFHRSSSEDAAFKSPRSDNGQYGEVRSPNSFNTTIIDERSQEAPTELQFKHQYHDPNSRKRDPSRVMDFCPPGKVCVRSSCRRYANVQAYAVLCRDQRGIVTFEYGSCLDSEVCVEGRLAHIGAMGIHNRAHCVSTQNFVNIANMRLGEQGQPPAQIARRAGQRRGGSPADGTGP